MRANFADAEIAPKPLNKALAHTFVQQLAVHSGGYVKPTLKVDGSPKPPTDANANSKGRTRRDVREQ